MQIRPLSRLSLGTALLLAAVPLFWLASANRAAAAPASPQLSVTVQVEREVVRTEDGGKVKTDREPVEVVRPGDVLVYTLKAVNKGDAPAFDVKLQDPIPPGTVLIMDSLERAAPCNASLDGGKTWLSFPATITRPSGDGRTETLPAPAEAYTNLRWLVTAPIAPSAESAVSFKVRVL